MLIYTCNIHIATPVNIGGRILLSTKNNGTRFDAFSDDGRILPTPLAWTPSLRPETSTPVAVDGLVFACSEGFFCLDLSNDLKTLYTVTDDAASESSSELDYFFVDD